MSDPNPGASPNVRFLAGDVPTTRIDGRRWWTMLGVSVLSHAALLLLAIFIITRVPAVSQALTPLQEKFDLTWLQLKGPGGGGGGGGNQMKEPPRKAELVGKQKITVPVNKPEQIDNPKPKDIPKLDQKVEVPVQLTAQGVQQLPGVIQGMPSSPDTSSLGNGTGTGSGGGNGSGIGAGGGSGLGNGTGGGTGGGTYRPGNGVSLPVLIKEVKPNYTGDAMRAKLQGVVEMEAVVLPDGSVGDVHVVRSLDSIFGLDDEAKKAVRAWRFRPGMLKGQPVPVLVSVELTFTLR